MKKLLLLIVTLVSTFVSAWAADAPKFLDTNKVWEYGYDLPNEDCITKKGSLYRYELDGTEEYNGRTYQVLWQTQEVSWVRKGWDGEKSLFEVDTIAERKKIVLLREENHKVYMPYLNDGPVVYENKLDYIGGTIPNYNGIENSLWKLIPINKVDYKKTEVNFSSDDEILIFDFNSDLEKGDNIDVWGIADAIAGTDPVGGEIYLPALFQYTVQDIIEESVNINNHEITTCTFKTYFSNPLNDSYSYNSYAGAIGPHTFILGPYLRFLAVTGIDPDYMWFNNLYDKEGNVIFAGENFKVPENNASVETMTTDESSYDRMYDVMGREIRNPQTGTIYIQNGRKFIAR